MSTNMDSFAKGEYMSVKASINPRLSIMRVLYVVPLAEDVTVVSVPLANIPMNKTATVYAIITMIGII